MKLLTRNAKLLKRNGIDYLIAGLSLAPHSIGADSDVCPSATAGCRSACVLWFTGRTVMQPIRDAMIRRKRFLLSDRVGFEQQLCDEIQTLRRKAHRTGLKPAIRLNVASDLDWSHIARRFPDCAFYDYTKVRSRLTARNWPSNYALTYSWNESSHPRTLQAQLARGGNVAAVFSTRYWPQGGRIDPLPTSWQIGKHSYPVVDGDSFDVRLPEIDGRSVIVGLRFKGSLKRRSQAIRNGFCIDETSQPTSKTNPYYMALGTI